MSAHLRNDGTLWALKHQQGVIDDVNVRVALCREWASHSPFVEPNWRTSFEPHRVAIETKDYYKVSPGGVKALHAFEQYLRAYKPAVTAVASA